MQSKMPEIRGQKIFFSLMSSLLWLLSSVNASEFMPVDQIKPEMKGYGLTVFKGTKVDTFDVEIVDVMKKRLPKGDVILARIGGKVVDTAGVIAGMSGSPIYIYENAKRKTQNAKLIGALAYNFAVFGKEPFAGITPIEEMLNPPSLGYIPPGEEFSQIKIPISCQGLPNPTLQELKKEIPCLNVMKTQETGTILDDSIIPSPGSALGIPLVEGDIAWYLMGTCTHREGNKIWALGHPLAGLGETELPMSSGYIYSVIPSSFFSHKMGTPTKIIGTIKKDNIRGISGSIGELPDLAELNLRIKQENFHYRIIKEKTLLPLLFGGLISYSIYTAIKRAGDITALANLEVKGSKNLSFKNLYTGTPQGISKSITEVFKLIQNNPFQKLEIKEISLNLIPSDTIKLAKIDEIKAGKKEVKPKDTLNLLISLSTYQEGQVKKHIPIEVPPWVIKGELWLNVESGKIVRNKSKDKIRTIEDLIRWLSSAPKDNELVITLSQKGKSGWISGQEFQALPPSIASFIETNKKTDVFGIRIPTEWVLTQKKSIKLEVK